jgi:endonuclease/exonuclease/phosphatase family metal-dependent hydrolase
MRRRVSARSAGVFRSVLQGVTLLVAGAGAASAQTTVTLSTANSQVWSATVRGGTYANTNNHSTLETRAASDSSYQRNALLKFDTQNTIPKGSNVTSAILTITVKEGSGDATRRIGAYQITQSWEEPEVTWNNRKSGTPWGSKGGDFGSQLAVQTVGNAAGTRVSFDVTPLVKEAVAGQLGSSRYTRLALKDLDSATSDSWRSYYTAEEGTSSTRPQLKVTYGGATVSSTSTGSGKTLRVLHWNIQKGGRDENGTFNPDKIVSWIVKMNPHVVSINEVESGNSYFSGDGTAMYKSKLESATGVTWYAWEAQDYGVWGDKGLRSVVFSRYPFASNYRHIYSAGTLKTVGGATIYFNGRLINFMSTHFDPYSSSYRMTQAKDLKTYASGFAEDRIICGDFNEQASNLSTITGSYYDAWAVAKSKGIAYSASDNPDGNTRNSRIDYIFYSRSEQHLTLQKVQVVDTRNSSGVMASDHRPVYAEFVVE